MTLRELVIMNELRPILRFSRRWSATLEYCEIEDGRILQSLTGFGDTAKEALSDMLAGMHGKRIVYRAMDSERRREFVCPETVELGDLQ